MGKNGCTLGQSFLGHVNGILHLTFQELGVHKLLFLLPLFGDIEKSPLGIIVSLA